MYILWTGCIRDRSEHVTVLSSIEAIEIALETVSHHIFVGLVYKATLDENGYWQFKLIHKFGL